MNKNIFFNKNKYQNIFEYEITHKKSMIALS